VSKAFTKEEAPEPLLVVPARAPWPEGVPNYVTPRGLRLLQAELEQLRSQRTALEAQQESSQKGAAQEQLLALTQRLHELEGRLASATLIEPPAKAGDQVRFGATVSLRLASGEQRRYTLVGVDEADAGQGRVSFVAPIARALIGRRVGESVLLKPARGEEELEILALEFLQD
jgi:transcription elongation factor GreB